MSDQALRARTVPELVDATFSLYRRNAPAYIMVTAMAAVPGLIAQLLLLGEVNEFGLVTSLSGFLVAIISVVTYALMNGVVIKMGSDVYLGGEADVASSVRWVLPKVGSLVAVAIMRGLRYILGFLFLIVGALYVLARFFAPEAAVVLENKRSNDAMARSSQLTDGRKMHVFRALLLGYGIYFLLAVAVGAVSGIYPNQVLQLVLSTAYTIIAYPIIGLLTMLLYYDCRIRAEGFDVEHLASTLGAPAANAARP